MPPDPLRIFAPGSPIPLVLLTYLLETLLPTLPGYAAAGPVRQAELRLVAMHMLAAHNPEDAHEAMLAASAVTTQAHATECMRLAALPGLEDEPVRRHRRLGAALLRCRDQALARLQRARMLRLKEAQIPSERSGWWFRDASVPLPGPQPWLDGGAAGDAVPGDAAPGGENPMHREAAAADGAGFAAAPAPVVPDLGEPRAKQAGTQSTQIPANERECAVPARSPRQDPMHRERLAEDANPLCVVLQPGRKLTPAPVNGHPANGHAPGTGHAPVDGHAPANGHAPGNGQASTGPRHGR